MSEKSFDDCLRKGLRARAELWKHCDTQPGIADFSVYFRVAGVTRWVELKATEGWPQKARTKVWWPHYTEHQMLFLRARRGWLFVRVGASVRSYFLFDWKEAQALWEAKGFTKPQMHERAARVWAGNVAWKEFEDAVV